MPTEECESMNIVPHILSPVRIIACIKSQQLCTRGGENRDRTPTLQNQPEQLLAFTNTTANPTIRPPNHPREIKHAAIAARNNPVRSSFRNDEGLE